MKMTFIPIVILSLSIVACNNNKPKESVTITSEDGKEQITIDANQAGNAAVEMEKTKEELSKLTLLKALVPEQLMWATHSDLDVNTAMGASVASADYKINDSMDINLNIIDCAGPGGAGIYTMQYIGLFNIQQEDEDEYTKTIDFNGGKAFENCKKTRNDCTLTFFAGGRFLITLEGDNVGIEALKDVAKGLKIK